MTRVLFFDWFNTLACYHPPREILHSQLLSEFGITISAEDLLPALLVADRYFYSENRISNVDNRPLEQQTKVYFKYGAILLKEIGIEPDKELVSRIIRRWPELKTKMSFALFDDVLPAVTQLKKLGFSLGLITNATKHQIAAYRKLGLDGCIDFVVTSEEAGAEKPDARIFLMALRQAAVAPDYAMHIGDQYEQDVAGARNAGIKPVLLDRYNLYSEITDCPRISGLAELPALIKSTFPADT